MEFNLSEKQVILQRSTGEFSTRELEPIAAQIDNGGKLPDDLIGKFGQMGWLGMMLPGKYGGNEASSLDCALVIEQLAYSGTGAWWLAAFNNSVPACIVHFGTEEVNRTVLKKFCNGSAYASIQFTEEDTGSDPGLLKTRAVIDADHYTINGMKRFSTFGARDGAAILFALDETGACTAFIIHKNAAGYQVQKQWDLMGGGGIEAVDVYFQDMKVPSSMVLGKKGEGFDILLHWIALEKIFQCSACLGMAQAAMDEALAYAKSRLVKEKPISKMQGIKWMLADMYGKLQAARFLTYRAASLFDNDYAGWKGEAAAAKVFVVPATIQVIDLARQIHGSYGYTRDTKIERLYRAAAGATGIATSMEINRSIAGDWVIQESWR